jgi:two-component system sensor histidine kinase MprB
MTLRTRIAVIAAAAVALAVVATSVGVYTATARTLRAGTDRELAQAADELLHEAPHGGHTGRFRPGVRSGPFGGLAGFVQVVGPQGRTLGPAGAVLPVSERAAAAADDLGATPPFYESTVAGDLPVRVLNVPSEVGLLRVALPTADTAEALDDLRRQLALGSLAGVVIAGVLGLAVAQRAVRPVHQLTELAEDVTRTGDLTRRIEVAGDDEVGRLAETLNGMLTSLGQARAAQQQLVADASHELRTPLTSLRTNLEVLADVDRLPEPQRRDLVRDAVGQLEEFGRLVDGLVELARGAQPARAVTAVRLDELVDATVRRLRAFAPDRELRLDLRPTTVVAEADRLERAVTNLIDNAAKYGRGPVEVGVGDGTVTVRDHGDGIAADDLPHVFDRFYRSPEARSAPGSGLGLSIVEQFATSHGGEVTAANAPGGGAVLTLRLPVDAEAPTLADAGI